MKAKLDPVLGEYKCLEKKHSIPNSEVDSGCEHHTVLRRASVKKPKKDSQ